MSARTLGRRRATSAWSRKPSTNDAERGAVRDVELDDDVAVGRGRRHVASPPSSAERRSAWSASTRSRTVTGGVVAEHATAGPRCGRRAGSRRARRTRRARRASTSPSMRSARNARIASRSRSQPTTYQWPRFDDSPTARRVRVSPRYVNVTTARRRNASKSVASAGTSGSDAIGAAACVADAAELHQRAVARLRRRARPRSPRRAAPRSRRR